MKLILQNNTMRARPLAALALCAGLAACGGGGAEGSDPAGQPGTPGQGSTTVSAEANGTIMYSHYQASNSAIGDAGFATGSASASATYTTASKQGSIQFPILDGTQTVTTGDGYATATWTGPFKSGAYQLNGNVLMGCDAAAASDNQATHVLVSTSMTRLREGAVDDLNGKTFDLLDCGLIKQASPPTLTVSADGSLSLSQANYTFPKNEVFNLLNPEKYSGALINNSDPKARGYYGAHAYRCNSGGAGKYVIVLQTNSNAFNDAKRYHFLIAIQR